MGTADHELLDRHLRDWLANASGFFIDSPIDFADDLTEAPLGAGGRRVALSNAAWVLLEKGGRPFVLAGIQASDCSGRECFTIFEHCVSGDNRVSFWNCVGPGEWQLFSDNSYLDSAQQPTSPAIVEEEQRVLFLDWSKCAGEWCLLDRIDLNAINDYGVYVIWKPNGDPYRPGAVVLVGRGNISARLGFHRLEREISDHGPNLRVTWAEVAEPDAAGVAAYLVRTLRPLVSDRLSASVTPIVANLPLTA